MSRVSRRRTHGGCALHDLNAATLYATDAVLMKSGTLAGAGPARDLLTPDAIRRVFDVEVPEVPTPDGHTLFSFSRRAD